MFSSRIEHCYKGTIRLSTHAMPRSVATSWPFAISGITYFILRLAERQVYVYGTLGVKGTR